MHFAFVPPAARTDTHTRTHSTVCWWLELHCVRKMFKLVILFGMALNKSEIYLKSVFVSTVSAPAWQMQIPKFIDANPIWNWMHLICCRTEYSHELEQYTLHTPAMYASN